MYVTVHFNSRIHSNIGQFLQNSINKTRTINSKHTRNQFPSFLFGDTICSFGNIVISVLLELQFGINLSTSFNNVHFSFDISWKSTKHVSFLLFLQCCNSVVTRSFSHLRTGIFSQYMPSYPSGHLQ